MGETVVINFSNGVMILYLNKFLPCSQQNFRKVLKLVRQDYRGQDEIYRILDAFINMKVKELEDQKQALKMSRYRALHDILRKEVER